MQVVLPTSVLFNVCSVMVVCMAVVICDNWELWLKCGNRMGEKTLINQQYAININRIVLDCGEQFYCYTSCSLE